MKLHSAKIEEKKIRGTHPGFRATGPGNLPGPFRSRSRRLAYKHLKTRAVRPVSLTPTQERY